MSLSGVVTLLSWALSLAALPVCAYLALLTLLSWRARPPGEGDLLPLTCVIPAHDEELGIARTVQSLLSADYPSELRRLVVVADNCTDGTAARAKEAGAVVLERQDASRRGKGFALEHAFNAVLKDPFARAVLVVDADAVVAPNLWRAVSARLSAGEKAVQVANVVGNPGSGWRPRLQAIGMAMMNGVRSLGRERLGLSVGLRGTGMALSRGALEAVPHEAHGIVEDVEYGARLGLAGIRVAFAPETWVASDAPVSAAASMSQRRRWEGGRWALVRTLVPSLLRAAWGRRSLSLLDLAIDLLVPPLSYVALVLVGGVALEAIHVASVGRPTSAWPLWAFGLAAFAAHVLRGVAFSGTGLRGLATLTLAPFYVAWKVIVVRPWRRAEGWVRTTRTDEDRPT